MWTGGKGDHSGQGLQQRWWRLAGNQSLCADWLIPTPCDHGREQLNRQHVQSSAGSLLCDWTLLLYAAKAKRKAQREAAKLKDVMEHSLGFQTALDPLSQVCMA